MADSEALRNIIVAAAGSSLVTALITQWLITRRERAHKRIEAKERREQRWAEFQMKTLVDLQNANERLVRVALLIALEMGGVIGNEMADDKFNKLLHDYTDIAFHIMSVVSLIDDDNVRTVTDELRSRAAKLSRIHIDVEDKSDQVAFQTARQELTFAMSHKFEEASAIIGNAVRKLR